MRKLKALVVGRFQYDNIGQITEYIKLYFLCCRIWAWNIMFLPKDRAQVEDVWEQSHEKDI
jgi:hypothetical protein